MRSQEWLHAVVDRARPYFATNGHPLPENIVCSTGWCHTAPHNTYGFVLDPNEGDQLTDWEIYVNPVLKDQKAVISILLHELIHVAVGPEHGHRGPFRQVATAFGFRGPLRYTGSGNSVGPPSAFLTYLAAGLGPYPHRRKK